MTLTQEAARSKPRKDPPVRKDGKCALDGCKKKRHPLDAFCSSECCRTYYEIPVTKTASSSSVT